MREIVRLSITSLRGSIGGEHYYGRLHVDTKHTRTVGADGVVGYSSKVGFGVEEHPGDRHEVTRRLTAKQALYLNKKDHESLLGTSLGLKAGSTTTRFDDKESIVAAAIAIFPKLFDETDVLVHDRERGSGVYEFLAGPERLRDVFAGRFHSKAVHERLEAEGYLLKTDDDPAYSDPLRRYLVNVSYQTESGSPGSYRDTVEARSEDHAYQIARERCHRRRKVIKIDGGDACEIL